MSLFHNWKICDFNMAFNFINNYMDKCKMRGRLQLNKLSARKSTIIIYKKYCPVEAIMQLSLYNLLKLFVKTGSNRAL